MKQEQSAWHEKKWEVDLEVFEGPLDLLLHLIRTLEIDIYDIPIAEITDQYLNYLNMMKELRLDIAADYLVMAATLMQIKSEMLLPRNENQSEELNDLEDTSEDPRQHLIEMLLEYKKFKKMSRELQEKEIVRSGYYTKLPSDISEYQQNIPLEKGQLSANDLLDAMKKILSAQDLTAEKSTTIQTDELTVFDQMDWITDSILQQKKRELNFSQLLKTKTKSEIVVTFLAILELMKKNKVYVKQQNAHEEIKIVLSEK
ncbi:segregation and condensation protein A [Allofustis seminis]|uniref:segregation and condensation protein A n=1 Tax=Allofustis seminis TaxID=166939 RepID=UPI00037A67BD|nr:segregation/condensation protein A [Allofustis seminis]